MLEYWTQSTCATCGEDNVRLTYARMYHIPVKVHIVDYFPDATVDRAKAEGVSLPFFTDGTGYWETVSDYRKSIAINHTDTAV